MTALYELVPASNISSQSAQYRYQSTTPNAKANSNEVATIKFRYKEPDGDQSKLIVKTVQNDILPLESTSDNYKYAASVAEFALLLRDSKYKGSASYDHILETAKKSRGADSHGYRLEFINLVILAKNMN